MLMDLLHAAKKCFSCKLINTGTGSGDWQDWTSSCSVRSVSATVPKLTRHESFCRISVG